MTSKNAVAGTGYGGGSGLNGERKRWIHDPTSEYFVDVRSCAKTIDNKRQIINIDRLYSKTWISETHWGRVENSSLIKTL